ncbi:MAG: hypothetical protein RMX96_31315 [Nostoc sp. ChiSLP02]|nr:hypothetical protein [Nostoc sp. DedSLP05]MDZ8098080.1 hypothetical protein [Nostoc sp. DedSLP01]MDZ8189314.1 hypothetical protein [Nostoc sp. ChiSLP02]
MKTATAIATTLAVLSLTAAPTLAAAYKYQVKGENAYASFYQSDECSYTDVYISAFNNLEKSAPGSPTSLKGLYLSYSTYNYCNGTYSYGDGFSDSATVTISNSLQSASVTGSVVLYDYYSGTSQTANVNLSWTGTGNNYRSNSVSHYRGPGYLSNYRSKSTSRDATATGSITIGGTNVIAGLSSYAYLSTSNSGSLNIYKPN